ncbi:MAG: hypothetical protein R2788_20695 [Saprospiraceae bacterium]
MKTLPERQSWWESLSEQWKMAFNEATLNKGAITDMPDEEGFEWILESPNFRFAGPRAFHPNMSFALTDLTGLKSMHQATMISATFHEITSIQPISDLKNLTALFLDNNKMQNINGVENFELLTTLVVSFNEIDSLLPVKDLKHLETLQIADNKLRSFEGLHEGNTENLNQFIGLPNRVSQTEIDRLQNELRVRVLKG